MLNLTRNDGEAIVIGGTVRVFPIRTRRGQTLLGVEAPDGVSIDREEIHEKKLAEQRSQSEGDRPAA